MSAQRTDHGAAAQHKLDRLNGDHITIADTPVALADLLEAQVHATLAVADALDRLLGHLEDRAITVRSE